MKTFLRRLIKFAAYTAAGVVILLAIAVGLFRLFLPRLPEYQDNIKSWASAAIGMEVEFSGMDARWGLSGPELAFYDTQLIREAAQTRVIAAEEVRVGIALTRLLLEGTPVVDLIVIRNTSVEIRQLDDGRWWIQGALADEWLGPQTGGKLGLSGAEVIGEDIEIVFLQPGDERPRFFGVPRATVSIDKQRLAVDARVRLPEDLGRELTCRRMIVSGTSSSRSKTLTLPGGRTCKGLKIDAYCPVPATWIFRWPMRRVAYAARVPRSTSPVLRSRRKSCST
jgi:hypothetical protein